MSHVTDELVAEVIATIDALDGTDPEMDHGQADAAIYRLLPPEVNEALIRAMKRADGWWWA